MRKISKMRICAIGLCIFLVAAVFSTAANGHNEPPIALDDEATMDVNEISVIVPILDNDYDMDGYIDNATVKIVDDPLHGKVCVDIVEGKVKYTRGSHISSKEDTFTYKVSDAEGAPSNIATVTITFRPGQENTPPVANNDTASIECNEKSIQIEVLTNDIDNEDGTPSLDNITKPPEHGDAIISGDKIQYTSEGDFAGIDSFVYQVIDSGGLTDTAIVNVTVFPCQENKEPVAVNDSAFMTEAQEGVKINVTENDYDPDGEIDPTTVKIVDDPLRGSVHINGTTGVITYIRNNNFIIGSDEFTYTVNDTEGATSNVATVTIQVNHSQIHCFPVADDDYYKTPEDARLDTVAPGVLDNDYTLSVSNVDECSLIAVLENDVSHGSLTLNEDGSFEYIPDDNWNGDDTFTYRACTEDQCSDIATVVLRVTSVNDAPVAVDDFANINRDTTVIIHVTENDNDIEDGEPNINNITRDPENGTVEIIDNLTLQYVSAVDFVGSDSFEYSVIDSGGLTDTATVFITVNQIEEPEEDPPVPSGSGGVSTPSSSSTNLPMADASAGEPYHGFVDEEITFDGSSSYVANGDIISWHWSFGDGTFINGEIVNHSYSSPKVYLVTLTVTDDKGATDICETIAVIVQPNRPPSNPEIHGPITCLTDISYSYVATATDEDGDYIRYVFDWGDGNIDESEFSSSKDIFAGHFMHSWNSAGTYTVTVTVSDNQTASSSEMSVLVRESSFDYTAVIILGSIVAISVIISLILVKTGKISKFGKK